MFDIIDQDKAFRLALEEERAEADIARAVIAVDNMIKEFGCTLEKACEVAGIALDEYHAYKCKQTDLSM